MKAGIQKLRFLREIDGIKKNIFFLNAENNKCLAAHKSHYSLLNLIQYGSF